VEPASRNRLLLFGALWGFFLAAVPAVAAFDDRFTVSPFLVAAYLCAALSCAVGTLAAGRRAAEERSTGRRGGWYRAALGASGKGVVLALATASLAAPSIWVAMALNMSGFSVENPAEVGKALNLFREPGLWLESMIVAVAVFAYTATVGVLLSPLTGAAINLLARPADPTDTRSTS
jgi:hypothetical protein